ncbi:MAG TPA: type II secretion system ATPase GspE [bacterium]|nr:type II secretion system ATPase GspE [bacterium]
MDAPQAARDESSRVGAMLMELTEYKQRLKIPAHDTTLERAVVFHHARTLEARGQFDDAINAYKKVLDLAPQDAVAYARLAALYVQRGLPRAAVMVFVALAEMHGSRDRWEKSAAAYEKAAELAPDDSDVASALRDVYIRVGKLREAARVQARIDRILTEAPRASAPQSPAAPPHAGPRSAVPGPAAPAMPVAEPAENGEQPDGAGQEEFPILDTPRAPRVDSHAPGASVPPPPPAKPAPRTPTPVPPPAPPKPARPAEDAAAKDKKKPKDPEPAAPARPAAQKPAVPSRPPAPQPARPAEPPKEEKRPRARSESLGQILLEEGIVPREQLEKAIQMQQRSGGGGHLGRILVELGAVTEQQLAKALALQWGLACIDLNGLEVDPDVVKVIPQHLAHRHKVLAIEKTRKKVKMVIADPLNVVALDDVRLVTGLDIEAVVAAEADILAAIGRFYASNVDLDEAMRAAVGSDLEIADDRAEELSVDKLRSLTEEAPVVRLVNLIISQAIADGGSDIHIEPHRRSLQVRYRIDGVLHDVMAPPRSVHQAMVSRIKIMANLDIAERRIPQDGRIHVVIENKEYDLRVSTLPTVFGEKVVMRILDQSTARLGLGKLGFAAAMLSIWEELASKPYGMVLVTGPTGSGKTTTLYSTLHKINTSDKNIITIEDPVEYQLGRVNQVQVNVKAGLTFANGLRSFLRQDPDIIMVGEIRDKETAEIAIQASLTGHLVLSTVHTNDAPSATTRLIDMGIEPFLITSSLIGVLAQRLARTICAHCKESYIPPVEALHRLGLQPEAGEEIVFYRGKGCERCKGAGYRGRVGIFELMVMSDAIRDLILKGDSSTNIREVAISEGMKTLREDGILKVLEGITTVDELLRVVFVET